MTQTFVYLIYNKNKNEVKIGYAADPIKRLSQLQVGTTDVLSIFSTFEGGVEEEKYLHQTLQEYRLSGEWFMNDYVVLKTVSDYILQARPILSLPLRWWCIARWGDTVQ